MVNAAGKPLSCTMEHDLRLQTVPNSARPNVSHLVSRSLRQILSLSIKKKNVINAQDKSRA